ncbi:hypothetical protein AVEN_160812-1 [Araneus ventricosus]|uniref:Uncharacterized protein n=1 Tax=Araneus ventricosus TaxID=182803 RepID=A0A4Y2J0F1_ARAVE|nr:hypothetical protein AVEN_160812-1 [Araneus ventricosus]
MDVETLNCCQMTRTTPELAPPPKLPHHTSARTVAPPLHENGDEPGPHARRMFGGIGIDPEYSNVKAETLPLGHRCPYYSYIECQFIVSKGYLVGPGLDPSNRRSRSRDSTTRTCYYLIEINSLRLLQRYVRFPFKLAKNIS